MTSAIVRRNLFILYGLDLFFAALVRVACQMTAVNEALMTARVIEMITAIPIPVAAGKIDLEKAAITTPMPTARKAAIFP